MKDLAVRTKEVWEENKIKFKKDLNDWLRVLEQGEKGTISQARKEFHQWDPLRVYVSVSRVRSSRSRVSFSLRFFGQEVGELSVEGGIVTLRLTEIHSKNNQKYFNCKLRSGDYDWNGQEAKRFRSFFKEIAITSEGIPKIKSIEHRIESKFIQEMLKGSGKFGVSDLEIQPVTFAKCPLQFPVPIKACKGKPEKGYGNIDILARHRGRDKKTRLSVWELKKPSVYGCPVSQAYIYALTLLYILRRTSKGSRWYKLFGYRSPIPKSLEIEAIVAITRDKKEKFEKEKDELQRNTSFVIDGDRIELYVAYYREESKSIKFEADPFS
ncbi:hypothetical protein ACFL5Z_07225 [Planctomycetota bacterium]